MVLRTLYLSLLTAISLAPTANAAAILIHPSSILYTTAPNQEGAFNNENTLIDGSGLSATPTIGNYLAVTHAGFTSANSWATVDPVGFPSDFFASGGLPQAFVIQLGATYSVGSIVVWGYHNGLLNNNSASKVILEFSTDGGVTWSAPLGSLSINTNASVGAAAEAAFSSRTANAVRATFTDNFYNAANPEGGGDRLGIAEIRFTGDETAEGIHTPEPSTLALAATASALLGLRAARRSTTGAQR